MTKEYENLYVFTLTPKTKKLSKEEQIKIINLMLDLGGDLPVAGGRYYKGRKRSEEYFKIVNNI